MGKLNQGKSGSAFIGLFAFVVVVLVVAALFMGLWAVLTMITGEDDAAPFIVCLVTAALAIVYQITNTRIIERKLPIQQERRVAKGGAYGKLMRACFDTMGDEPGVSRIQEQEFFSALHDSMQDVLVHGSDEVIQRFGTLINLGKSMDAEGVAGDQRGMRLLATFGQLLQAMRDDIGHEESQLKPAQLKRVFMPDYDALIAKG